MSVKLFNQRFSINELWKMKWSLMRPPLHLGKDYNFSLIWLSQFLRRTHAWGLPPFLMIEPTGCCDMACPMCPILHWHGRQKAGYMDMENYRRLIREIGSRLYAMSIWGWGEPMLHPQLPEMISIAKGENIFTAVSTNAYSLDREKSCALVDAGLDYIIFSVDGATEDTYSRYRGKGRFHEVMANIRGMSEIRAKKKSPRPFLNLQFIVMRDNEHEIALIKQLSKELGVDKLSLKKVQAFGEKGKERFLPREGKYHLKLYYKELEATPCWRPWTTPLILWNGDMIACCGDLAYAYNMGNVFPPNELKSIWNSEKFVSFREKMLTDIGALTSCRECAAKSYQDGFMH